jgi:D-xylonolactonase
MDDAASGALPRPEMVADTRCEVGEGPLWHPNEQAVYWVDIVAGQLFRHDPATGRHELVYESPGEAIGGFTLQADGALLLFQSRGAIRRWRAGRVETIVAEIPEERDGRFNDVIADPEGRVFCGTMPIGDRPGVLYRLDRDGTIRPVFDDAGVSNGMGFTPDLRRMYHTNSMKYVISIFDYDRASGELTNRQDFVRTPKAAGILDGMTVDANGDVWSARWDGSALHKFSPSGEELLRIPFPAKKVSSIVFGGPEYEDAYVTIAGGQDRATEGPGAGALYRIRLGVRGVPEFRSRIGL